MKNLEEIHQEDELSKLKEEAKELERSGESSEHARRDKKKKERKKKKKGKRSSSTSSEGKARRKGQRKEEAMRVKKKEKVKKKKKKRSSSGEGSQRETPEVGIPRNRPRSQRKEEEEINEESAKIGKGGLQEEQEGGLREEFQWGFLLNKRRRCRGGEFVLRGYSGQEDLEQVPRSSDRGVDSGDAKSSPDHTGAGLGVGFGKDPSCSTSVLQASVGRKDAACHEAGSASLGVHLRPGPSGQTTGTPRCGLPTSESPRESGCGKPLHDHYTVTSKMELVPQEQGMVATVAETEKAARLAREDWKIRSAAVKPHGSQSLGSWETKGGKDPKGKGKGKDKNDRKGGNPNYAGKGDGKEDEKKDWPKKK